MAKVTLGKRPKTFKTITVDVTMPDGEEGKIPVTFVYRTKSEFGRWMDETAAKAKAKAKQVDADEADDVKNGEPAEELSWEKIYAQSTEVSADHLLGAIDSWELEIPLNREALLQLGDEVPAAPTAILSAYGAACREGRLGNS